MTLKGRILLEAAQYAAMAAGILTATSGRFKLLAATIPLAFLGPFWIWAFFRWRRARRAPTTNPPGAT